MRLHWNASTRYHDWSADGRAPARRMIERLAEAGLIGAVEWYAAAPDDTRREAAGDDRALERLLDRPDPPRRIYGFTAGGSRPAPWELALQLPRFIAEDREAEAINVLRLWFDDDRFAGAAGSDALARAFRSIHGPENTEVAYIHPWARWLKLTDPTMDGAYGDALTLAPMLQGVLWATFVGDGHLDFFDVRRLQRLKAHEVAWIGDEGVFLRVCEDVREAVTPEVEKEMLRLTGAMRHALK